MNVKQTNFWCRRVFSIVRLLCPSLAAQGARNRNLLSDYTFTLTSLEIHSGSKFLERNVVTAGINDNIVRHLRWKSRQLFWWKQGSKDANQHLVIETASVAARCDIGGDMNFSINNGVFPSRHAIWYDNNGGLTCNTKGPFLSDFDIMVLRETTLFYKQCFQEYIRLYKKNSKNEIIENGINHNFIFTEDI